MKTSPPVDAVLSSVLDRAPTCPFSSQPTLHHPTRSCPSRVPTSLVTSPGSILVCRMLFAPLEDPCSISPIRLLRSAVYGTACLSRHRNSLTLLGVICGTKRVSNFNIEFSSSLDGRARGHTNCVDGIQTSVTSVLTATLSHSDIPRSLIRTRSRTPQQY